MSEESQPLLRGPIRNIEPEFDEQPAVTAEPYPALQPKWWKSRCLGFPFLKWLWYPIFCVSLWTTLMWQSFEGILYRAACNVCRKRVGTVDQWSRSASDGCQCCALFEQVLSDMAPQIEPHLGLFMVKSESWFKKFPMELNIWNVGGFERAKFRILAPRGKHLLSLDFFSFILMLRFISCQTGNFSLSKKLRRAYRFCFKKMHGIHPPSG